MRRRIIPLFPVFREVFIEGGCKGLQQIRDSSVLAVAKCQPQGKIMIFTPVELPSQGYISLAGFVELPIHFEILKVGPSIARPHISARRA